MCKRNNLFNRFSGLQTELKALNQSDTNICVGINIWINSFTFIKNTTLRQRQSVHFSGLHKQEEELGDVPSFTPAAIWIKGNIVKRFSKCCLLKYLKATLQIPSQPFWKAVSFHVTARKLMMLVVISTFISHFWSPLLGANSVYIDTCTQ